MFFYSMQNSKIKLMMEKFLPIMLYWFSNDFFCTNEIPYSAHWKFNKQKKFNQAFYKYSATQVIISCIFETMNKKLGQWCKFGDKGQYIQILF